MAWIRLTGAKSGREAHYNTDNIVEIAPDTGSGTRIATLAASGSPLSIDTKDFLVREDVEEVMRRVRAAEGDATA